MVKRIKDMTGKQTAQKDLNNIFFKCWRKCNAKNSKRVTLKDKGRRQW